MEKIRIVPTWQAALVMITRALESGNSEGKKAAKELLKQMADVAQIAAEIQEFIEKEISAMPEEPGTHQRVMIEAYTNISNLYKK